MKCTNCNFENKESAKFCIKCGTPLNKQKEVKEDIQNKAEDSAAEVMPKDVESSEKITIEEKNEKSQDLLRKNIYERENISNKNSEAKKINAEYKNEKDKLINKIKKFIIENNQKYIIYKLIGVVFLVNMINYLFPSDWLNYYIYKDGRFIPVIFYSYILCGIAEWFILKKYVNFFYLIITVVFSFSFIMYFDLNYIFGLILGISQNVILFFTLKNWKGLFLKWSVYIIIPSIGLSLITQYILFPFVILPLSYPIVSYVCNMLFGSVLAAFLGLFFIKVYFPVVKNL